MEFYGISKFTVIGQAVSNILRTFSRRKIKFTFMFVTTLRTIF